MDVPPQNGATGYAPWPYSFADSREQGLCQHRVPMDFLWLPFNPTRNIRNPVETLCRASPAAPPPKKHADLQEGGREEASFDLFLFFI